MTRRQPESPGEFSPARAIRRTSRWRSPPAHSRYRQQILGIPLQIAPIPSREEIEAAAPIAGEKDAHVLAAAVALGVPFLITLDRPLLARVNRAALPLRARLPGDFIREDLPTHPGYPAGRE